eukprot:TRINITY_DN4954_c1_g1_i1.p1 TRINITY_DN4954_c1_g1~~TRINITY_DN4954_c1_g1_i1.p1  ORF type:complete len:182 (+),score=20.09 TRINITY_DN4954_c1_g1_i1:247-792(+)
MAWNKATFVRATTARRVQPSRALTLQCRAQAATLSETRKLLASRGWDRSWIDGITERISRRQLQASVDGMNQVLDAMEEVDLKAARAQHVCCIAWRVLDRDANAIRAVVDHLKSRGVSNPGRLIFNYPKLLEYTPAGEELENGRARAKVTISGEGAEQQVLVSFYSANAKFNSAPVSPWSP